MVLTLRRNHFNEDRKAAGNGLGKKMYLTFSEILSQFVRMRREEYSNVLQTHIVIVGQVRILVFLFRCS